jgi:hypothetical protein
MQRSLLVVQRQFPKEPLNNAPFGISQKCQPPTAPWRGLLQRLNLLKRLVYSWCRRQPVRERFAPTRSGADISAKSLLNQRLPNNRHMCSWSHPHRLTPTDRYQQWGPYILYNALGGGLGLHVTSMGTINHWKAL